MFLYNFAGTTDSDLIYFKRKVRAAIRQCSI